MANTDPGETSGLYHYFLRSLSHQVREDKSEGALERPVDALWSGLDAPERESSLDGIPRLAGHLAAAEAAAGWGQPF